MTQLLGRLPCTRFPQDATYKTIGLDACPDCGTSDCWLHYLRWEVSRGITLNAKHHHLVTSDKDQGKVGEARRAITESGVVAGQVYRHNKTSSTYRVIALSVDEVRLVPLVTYGATGVPAGYAERIWTRDLDVFLGKRDDGTWRFSIVEGE